MHGTCFSACTLYLGLLPRGQVCASGSAEFWFHAPYDLQTLKPVPESVRWSMRVYPPGVRAWIARHGGLGPAWIVLKGAEMRALVPAC